MAIKIGHAVVSEKNNKYGNPGDQTGREVRYDDWYDGKWNVVLRPKSSNVAEKIARAMEQAIENEAIGYNQKQRTTLYEQAQKRNWQIHLIITKCECDCSSLVAVCVNAAGIKVSKDIYTGNMVKALEPTGAFEKKITDKKYLRESSYLKRGDILVCEGKHTAIVLSNGDKVEKVKEVNYSVCITAFRLNVRQDANSKSKIVSTLKHNSTVVITKESGSWGYSKTYGGWINLTYTKKNISQRIITPRIMITTTSVNFRTEPISENKKNIITKFNKGQYLLITTERTDGWVYGKSIVDGSVKAGWIFADYLSTVNCGILNKRKVTDSTGLNVRSRGNIKASVICNMPKGSVFEIIKDGAWGVIVYKDYLGYSSLDNEYSKRV